VADLVTLDQVRAHLNIDEDDTSHDDELNLFIDAATAHAEDRYGSEITSVPADLKLAVLEDIRGLFQPAQVGPIASFGAFDTPAAADVTSTFRPVRMWPRIDAWLDRSMRTSRAPAGAFPDAVAWPDPAEYPGD
jgi:hypothetical protein